MISPEITEFYEPLIGANVVNVFLNQFACGINLSDNTLLTMNSNWNLVENNEIIDTHVKLEARTHFELWRVCGHQSFRCLRKQP